jgi:hypothetical protein
MFLADGLGATIDDFEYRREVAVAEKAFDIKAGRAPRCTPSTRSPRYARRRRESVRSLTFR